MLERRKMLYTFTQSMDLISGKTWKMVRGRDTCALQSKGSQRFRHSFSTEQLQDYNKVDLPVWWGLIMLEE